MIFTDLQFGLARDLLAASAGLVFDESRRGGLASALRERARASDCADIASYLSLVSSRRGAPELQKLLDAVTVQETMFFRAPPQIAALRRGVLPELLQAAADRERPLTIWSAGCSTGEEPYTLAMMLLELAPTVSRWPQVRIVGTDVSTDALETARLATYSGRTVQAAPASARGRWFEPGPGGALAVRDEPRSMVEFAQHNLVTESPPFAPGEVDLVVCRNVTIYFARETTRALVGRFHHVLSDGGYLLLGHSETLWKVSDAFALVAVGDAFVYRSTQASAALPSGAHRARRPERTPRPERHPRPAVVPSGAERVLRPLRDDKPGAARLRAARAALADGDYAEAARAADLAAVADPLVAESYLVLGHALTNQGMDEEALGPLRKSVYLDPSDAQAQFLLAGCLSRLGQHGQAAVAYRATASALYGVDPSMLTSFLGGREVDELADLCRRLAELCDASADAGRHRATADRNGS